MPRYSYRRLVRCATLALPRCPFCGGVAMLRAGDAGPNGKGPSNFYWTECAKCGATGPTAEGRMVEVCDRWSHRAPLDLPGHGGPGE